jgi:hypothetical protein
MNTKNNATPDKMKSVLRIRVSDNVLDPEDWPVRKLVIEDGQIVEHTDMTEGIYSFSKDAPQTGKSLEYLVAWASVDNTGKHPEIYHDVMGPDGKDVHYVSSQEQLHELLTLWKVTA